jgi:hypothetical protein
MKRCQHSTITVLVMLAALSFCIAEAASPPDPAPDAGNPLPPCDAARDYATVTFEGNRLTETPDIENPDLRRMNSAISAHCFEWVESRLEIFTTNHSADFHVFFLRARLAWVLGDRTRAQLLVEAVLRQRPDFTSAKVLRASMAIDDQDYQMAMKLLDDIRKEQPEDLWAYIDRLRLEALLTPSAHLTDTLRAFVRDDRFPPNARQQAAYTARYENSGASQQAQDSIFADQMKVSPVGADCTLANQAMDVIEMRSDPSAGAKLIEKYRVKDGRCTASPLVRTLLAEAYLWQAAKIAPTSVAANSSLIKKARKAMDGDFTPVAQRIALRPFLAALLPLISDAVDPREPDENGRTVLCNAVLAFNPISVQAELDRGADPKSACDGRSPVSHVILVATREKVSERQRVLRLLLERGADVEDLEGCARPENGDCWQVLLPILQEFKGQRKDRGI